MKKQKKVILGVILLAVLLMGIGYAVLTSTTLNIKATASATANPDQFKVVFTGADPTLDDKGTTATATAGSIEASVIFSEMTDVNDERSAILEIQNQSTQDITAKSVGVTTIEKGNEEYFDITATRCNADGSEVVAENTALPLNEKTYVKVTAKLIKAPAVDNVKTEAIKVTLTATPQEQTTGA